MHSVSQTFCRKDIDVECTQCFRCHDKLAFNKTLHVNTHELFIISPKSGDNKMLEEISRC